MGFLGILVPLLCCWSLSCCWADSCTLDEVTGGEDICDDGAEDDDDDVDVDVGDASPFWMLLLFCLRLLLLALGFQSWPAPPSRNQGGRGR